MAPDLMARLHQADRDAEVDRSDGVGMYKAANRSSQAFEEPSFLYRQCQLRWFAIRDGQPPMSKVKASRDDSIKSILPRRTNAIGGQARTLDSLIAMR
jgi:hypothetical protein